MRRRIQWGPSANPIARTCIILSAEVGIFAVGLPQRCAVQIQEEWKLGTGATAQRWDECSTRTPIHIWSLNAVDGNKKIYDLQSYERWNICEPIDLGTLDILGILELAIHRRNPSRSCFPILIMNESPLFSLRFQASTDLGKRYCIMKSQMQ